VISGDSELMSGSDSPGSCRGRSLLLQYDMLRSEIFNMHLKTAGRPAGSGLSLLLFLLAC